MEASTYLKLHPSEGHVLAAASRIYAGHVAAGHVTPEIEADLVKKSIDLAIGMALTIDDLVQTEDEVL